MKAKTYEINGMKLTRKELLKREQKQTTILLILAFGFVVVIVLVMYFVGQLKVGL